MEVETKKELKLTKTAGPTQEPKQDNTIKDRPLLISSIVGLSPNSTAMKQGSDVLFTKCSTHLSTPRRQIPCDH